MTISYNWLSEFLPKKIESKQLSEILTSIGLEVESLEQFETIKGSLKGVVIGQIEECRQHPGADKLKLTTVNVGTAEPLKIVCGAPNAAVGQKVLVATTGTTIYPVSGHPVTIKAAKIRGEESQGMICAEDEIGLGLGHEGIMILPEDVAIGMSAADYFKPYQDWIFEIGLTPNRMDAMSHYGVARDVCAYLSHHTSANTQAKSPFHDVFKPDNNIFPIKVIIENTTDCKRYAGVTITGAVINESPKWLHDKLVAIGQKPINNVVDITNYVLHETGQPLHAFDADAIKGGTVIVKNVPVSEAFITLDEKERKLSDKDLMICNAEKAMCIAGVFGGAESGVKPETKNIFLESAWFKPASIRATSLRHGLRTEAATRFEKGVDISNVVHVLKRAALLIKEVAGGKISSDITDVYPFPEEKTKVTIKYSYLKKLSGKEYQPDVVSEILKSLDFEIVKDDREALTIAVPFSKPDITLPADIVEEILRIDGLDNVQMPGVMTITPSAGENILKENLKEKIAGFLTGLGCNEIVTNSITNSKYYNTEELSDAVKMINSLSAELDVMRPSMVETGLEIIAYNINRKNKDLKFFEFGKTYHTQIVGQYTEKERLALYFTGETKPASWKTKAANIDLYEVKGIANAIANLCGAKLPTFAPVPANGFAIALSAKVNDKVLVNAGEISSAKLKEFDIKQPVFFVDFDWQLLIELAAAEKTIYKEVSKFPAVQRDLAVVVNKNISFDTLTQSIDKLKISKLQHIQLFDIFESEKLGQNKKSMAVTFTFGDEEKTMTDKEVDTMMSRLIKGFETELGAEIRK